MIQQERRSHNRKTLNPLPYIDLGSDIGGIVLDVSEQGLRFRTTASVEPSGPIRFSFSAHSDLVEGMADLVWMDQAQKTGGLRFTELSDNAREMIRKWPHEADLQLTIGQDFMLHMPPSDESSRAGARRVFDATLQFASTWSRKFTSTLQEYLQFGRGKGLPALGALSIVIVVILASGLSYVHHRAVGEWLVRLGARIAGEGQLQAVAQAPPSALSMQLPAAGEMPADRSKGGPALEQAVPQAANAVTPSISKGNALGPSLPQARATNAHLPTHATPGRELVVQVAALKQEAEARELADSLQHKNFQAFVRTLPADALYRVLLGPYANQAAARTAVDQLKKAGFAAFVRREPGAELTGSLRIPTP